MAMRAQGMCFASSHSSSRDDACASCQIGIPPRGSAGKLFRVPLGVVVGMAIDLAAILGIN